MIKNYTASAIVLLISFSVICCQTNAQVTKAKDTKEQISIGHSITDQVVFAQWNFDAGSLLPSTGTGTADNTGGTSTEFVSGNPATGKGWNTSQYPAQGTASGTAGVQFNVSTKTYNDITILWETRNSNTAANRIRLQYTVNGTNWIDFVATNDNASNKLEGISAGFDNGRFITTEGGEWFERIAEFAEIDGSNNNPLFAVRIVTEFTTGQSYAGSATGSDYGTTGTIRYDNVTIAGVKITGIDDIPDSHWKVYAYDNKLFIERPQSTLAECHESSSAKVQVINLQGQVVSAFNILLNNTTYPLNIPNGIYVVKISTPETINSYKMLIK